jgi:hypothetical protein
MCVCGKASANCARAKRERLGARHPKGRGGTPTARAKRKELTRTETGRSGALTVAPYECRCRGKRELGQVEILLEVVRVQSGAWACRGRFKADGDAQTATRCQLGSQRRHLTELLRRRRRLETFGVHSKFAKDAALSARALAR